MERKRREDDCVPRLLSPFSGWRRERTRQVQHREFAAPSCSISVERRVRAAGGMPFAHVANQVPAGQYRREILRREQRGATHARRLLARRWTPARRLARRSNCPGHLARLNVALCPR